MSNNLTKKRVIKPITGVRYVIYISILTWYRKDTRYSPPMQISAATVQINDEPMLYFKRSYGTFESYDILRHLADNYRFRLPPVDDARYYNILLSHNSLVKIGTSTKYVDLKDITRLLDNKPVTYL